MLCVMDLNIVPCTKPVPRQDMFDVHDLYVCVLVTAHVHIRLCACHRTYAFMYMCMSEQTITCTCMTACMCLAAALAGTALGGSVWSSCGGAMGA